MTSCVLLLAALWQASPRPAADPFATARPAELGAYRAVLETSKGKITLEFLPTKAPETVRNFLRLAAAEVYDNTPVHRVVPHLLIQTGAPFYRQLPLSSPQRRLIHNLPPEFNDTKNMPGIVSMARDDDPGSAQTSFFICTGNCKAFDGKYTAFAKVVAGMAVVNAIAAVPVNGERPKEKVMVIRVTVAKTR
jgi:peptidyl-prolyl cis-trans isomerase B (cyclophilin B)